jgi:PAS domain S-box-containing protein
VAVGLVLALAAVLVAVFTNRILGEQEDHLLDQRTTEVVSLLTATLSTNEAALDVLVADSPGAASAGAPSTFTAQAQAVARGRDATVAIVDLRAGSYVPVDVYGNAFAAGQPLSPARAAVVARAAERGGVAADLVQSDVAAGLVYAVPAPDGRTVALLEVRIDPATPGGTSPTSALRGVRARLYAAPRPDPAKLVSATEDPPSGRVVRRTFPVGGADWYVEVAARGSLVGSAAEAQPWLMLGVGLVLAAGVATGVELLARRRAYAEAVADSRTGELRRTLGQLDDLRGVIERLLNAGETAVVRTEAPGNRVTYVSPNIERLFGLRVADARDVNELNDRVHPDDRAAVAQAQHELLRQPANPQRVVARLRHGDDRHRWTRVLLVADRDAERNLRGTLWYISDIDDERTTAEALRQREATLSAVLSASPDVITIVGRDGTVRGTSPAAEDLTGFPADRFTATAVVDHVHPDDRDVLERTIATVLAGDRPHAAVEVRTPRADGAWVVVEAQVAPLLDDDGAPSAVVLVSRDVTDRVELARSQRAAQQAAEDANRAKSEFLSRMSHELRTPLNAVLGFGQLLALDDLGEEQRESVDHILKGGRHLLDLINEVLDISRIETGKLPLSPEPVLVAELVEESVDLVRPLARQRSLNLVTDPAGSCDCFMFADRQRVKQVLLNLLSNAVKYNRNGGTIALSCDTDEHHVRVAVADSGVGMRPDQLDRIFTPFERLGAEQTDVEGTGIGLALSLRLAEAMGGTINVQSTLGEGSTFTLELPRVEGPVERYERLGGGQPAPEDATPPEARTIVLHIEDNLSNLSLVERIMAQRSDIEVVAAMQGRLGLELAREHQPVLVLLDLHLPDMHGEQVLQRLRDDPETASIPVVIVSADATPGQVQRVLASGAAAYLTKPIDVRELLAQVDAAVAARR